MKKHRFFYVMLLVFILSSIGNIYSQPGCITLSFAGDNNGTPVNLDSVWIKNITQNCDTTIYPPDLSLVIDTLMTGSVDHQITGNGFTLRNNPNPFRDRTTIMINLPAGDYVKMITVSQTGQVEAEYSGWLDEGFSTFEFAPGRGSVHLLTVFWRDQRLSVKLISNGSQKISCSRLTLLNQSTPDYKSISEVKSFFDYDPGDQLLMVGYGDDLESGLLDSPAMSNDYVFQFATNIPCPGLDSLEYEGKYYHTIQIMSQCWLKENLDAGTMIMGNQSPSDNGIIEKYCYSNSPQNCEQKGALYLWDEMMEYITVNGSQGICPDGWHIPTDEEFKVLEGVADSQYGIGHPVWNASNAFRGIDCGKNLKSTTGWNGNGNGVDIFGFTFLSGGYWWENGFFENTVTGICWTSSLSDQSLPWYRGFVSETTNIGRFTFDGLFGISVRCLKNQ